MIIFQEADIEAAAKAIYETWYSHPLTKAGQKYEMNVSWDEAVKASEAGAPESLKIVTLARAEARAALTAAVASVEARESLAVGEGSPCSGQNRIGRSGARRRFGNGSNPSRHRHPCHERED